jgi:hypothetical protein
VSIAVAMRRAVAPLLVALAFGTVPALASASTGGASPSTTASGALRGLQLAAGDTNDNSANASGPVVPAPVPDPFLADALKACRDGASGDKGTVARLTADGWAPSIDGDTQTPFYQAFSGEKDFDGVGTADITFSQEVYPTMTEGYCSVSIDTALRQVGVADLNKMSDLTGQMLETDDGVASTWEVKGASPNTFIQVDQHNEDLYFILDVTTLMQKPAARLTYVQPDITNDEPDDNGSPSGDSPDTTNAND